MTPAFSVHALTDVARIEELHGLITTAFRVLAIDPPSGVLKETVEDFRNRLQTEKAFVVEVDGALIGGVFCAPLNDSLYVGRLAVRDDFKRKGIASALLDAAKAEAERRGFARVTLSSRIALKSNIALFRKHGFVVVGESAHPGFSYPTSCDMELKLG